MPPLTIEELMENLMRVTFSLGDTVDWTSLGNLHGLASGLDGRLRRQDWVNGCGSKNAGSRPCMLRKPAWRLGCCPPSHLGVG